MIRHAKLTGRRRYRRGWRGRLILQLEYTGLYTSHICGNIDTEEVTAWRDARLEDLTTEEVKP